MADRFDDNRGIERVLPPERTQLETRTVSRFEAGEDLITQRFIEDARNPTDARGSRTLSNDVAETYAESNTNRYIAPIREALAQRDYNRVLANVASAGSSQTQSNTDTSFVDALKNYYNPASSAAGSGLNASGGISVIPGGDVQSGNSNTLLIFLVIAAGIGIGYWYYKRNR